MSLIEKQKMKEIKLKSQPKCMVRMFILVGAILGGVFAFISHPIGGTNAQSMDCPEGKFLATGNVCITDAKDIVIQATATEVNQTLKINKYFANAYTVDRGDGTTGNLTVDTTHTYSLSGTYSIILSLSGAERWGFQNPTKPLIPANGTTMTGVQIIYMPSLSDGFGDSETNPGNYFFQRFNQNGVIVSLPDGSFDTSHITAAGDSFFKSFNVSGLLTSLPGGSFNISNITIVGNQFFQAFNELGGLTGLPAGSFHLSSGLSIVGNEFFGWFNNRGALTSLPKGSFNTDNIMTVGDKFFTTFNQYGALINLPGGSFNISNITIVKDRFFSYFNCSGKLTNLPEGSFNTDNITEVGDDFFRQFNDYGNLISLPFGSFNITNITTVGVNFFTFFNRGGLLESLPLNSFDTSNISGAVETGFFDSFNRGGALTNLPEGSFNISNITAIGDRSFYGFNMDGALTSLPEGSFNTSNITSVGNECFTFFNYNGSLINLSSGSFNTSNITKVGSVFFGAFNYQGALTSLPEGSFNTDNITVVGDNFFDSFNYEGVLTSLPDSFTINSTGASVADGYAYAFNSPNYTINRNVYDLVSGVEVPLEDRDIFSDNQPGRCGVHSNWLETTTDACSISYDSNLGTNDLVTKKYTADTTSLEAGDGVAVPIGDGLFFDGWYTDSVGGELVENVIFPSMDGDTLYAHWEIGNTVTFDANGGTTNQTTQTVAENTSINLPNTSRDGYEFLGWYTEETGGIRVGEYNDPYIVSQDITLYAHWSEVLPDGIFFQTGDITYTDTNGKVFSGIGTITIRSGGETITILDRNLGATTNDTGNDDSLGYYFQWGNNYGFTNDSGINNIDLIAVSGKLDTLGNGWNNPYISNIIITDRTNIGNAETYNINSNLWGGSGDSINNNWGEDTLLDGYKRQGPCPEGFHVPSQGERDKLVKLRFNKNKGYQYVDRFWVQNNLHYFYGSNYLGTLFLNNFLLRERSAHFLGSDQYNNPRFQGWSSSSDINGFRFGDARSGSVTMIRAENRPDLKSVRCFKDMTGYLVMQYETNGGTPIQAQTTVSGEIGYLPGYTTQKTGVDFLGWYINSECTEKVELSGFTFNKIITGDTIFYAGWGYDYILLDRDESVIESGKVLEGKNINPSVLPNRNGYTFVGRDKDLTNISGNLVARAIYQKKEISNGGGTKLSKDYCPGGDYSDSYYDGDCGTDPKVKEENDEEENQTGHNSAKNEVVYDTLRFNPHYSDEMNQAYQFAYHYGITTKTNIKDAAMNWELTRIAMAKMLSQYAINVLGIKPDTTRYNDFTDVSDKLDSEYDEGVTLAYQLGIMGINMPNNEFKPYNYVTRAEFATAFSRLLYNTPDGIFEGTSKYYTPHISKLAYEGILTNTNPYMKELRGYVMLMLMRSAK